MLIRKARAEENQSIAKLMLLAMEDIVYEFIGRNDKEQALQFLATLIQQKNTPYSYENCWVVESNQEVVAVANVYDGGKLKELRVATKDLLKSRFNKDFTAEDETQAGEFYIDCVGVDPNQQGKGIGSKIFNFLIEEYVNKRKMPLGLLVDKENPNAKRLYLKLGFQLISEKTLTGKAMEHLQFLPQNNL